MYSLVGQALQLWNFENDVERELTLLSSVRLPNHTGRVILQASTRQVVMQHQ